MSETRTEDVTPLTERKSINSSFFFFMAQCLQPSQQSEADVRQEVIAKACIIALHQIGEKADREG